MVAQSGFAGQCSLKCPPNGFVKQCAPMVCEAVYYQWFVKLVDPNDFAGKVYLRFLLGV